MRQDKVLDRQDLSRGTPWLIGRGPAAQAKHGFQVGQTVSGLAEPVANADVEVCESYKASAIRVSPAREAFAAPPPWRSRPPALEVYRARGHRRLD